MRRRLKDALKAAGYARSVVVEDGQQALDELPFGYNFLITALDLPGLDCWRLLRMIRSGAFCSPELPVLIICDARLMSVAEPMALGCQAHLLAENDLERLLDVVAGCLDGPNKPTVLAVEDDPGTARLIGLSLRDRFDVDAVPTGRAGLAAWRAKQHELVLLDLMLPDTNGLDVLQHIVAAKAIQLVVVITARSEQKTHRELMEAGAVAFLPKPLDFFRLPAFCGWILRRYGAYRQQRAELERQQENERFVIQRIIAASHLLRTGRAGLADQQLRHAIAAQREQVGESLGEDEWMDLLNEFGSLHYRKEVE